jgi:hypothetical protein
MTLYIPPIEKRDTDELIIICNSSTDDWQQDAIDSARAELLNRGYSHDQINSEYNEIEKGYNQMVQAGRKIASEEDFFVLEKLWIILFWPRELFHHWYLKREGFILKRKRRIQLILLGILLYAVFYLTLI